MTTDSNSRAKNRPKRTPLHKRRVLEGKQRPGFVRRWVNQEVGRIDDFLAAGWTPVSGDQDASDKRAQDGSSIGANVTRVVNRGADARSHNAVLMEIPEDLYNEDQKEKQKEVDRVEASYNPEFNQQGGADYGTMTQTYN